MDLWLGIAVGIALTLLVLVLVGRRRLAGGVDPTQLTFDESVMRQVADLVARDRRIEAIALLRTSNPGLGLGSAKTMVDRMAAAARRGAQPPAVAAGAAEVQLDSVPSLDALALEVELDARNLKAQGNPIGAIKLVREHTGWGLKESKDFVDGL